MGFFEGASIQWFYDRPDGTSLCAPWGRFGHAYVMTVPDRQRFVRRWGWLTTALGISVAIAQPLWWGGPGMIAVLAFVLVVEWAAIRFLLRGLVRVRPDRDSLVHGPDLELRGAQAMGAPAITAVWVGSVAIAGLSAWAAFATGREVFVASALAFGAGTWLATRQLLLLRRARAERR